jgi:hypothetical protein
MNRHPTDIQVIEELRCVRLDPTNEHELLLVTAAPFGNAERFLDTMKTPPPALRRSVR